MRQLPMCVAASTRGMETTGAIAEPANDPHGHRGFRIMSDAAGTYVWCQNRAGNWDLEGYWAVTIPLSRLPLIRRIPRDGKGTMATRR